MRIRHRIELSGAYQSGYEVESLPFDKPLNETKLLPINGLRDLLQAAMPVWAAQLSVEGPPPIRA
jgi:hypothetical protein